MMFRSAWVANLVNVAMSLTYSARYRVAGLGVGWEVVYGVLVGRERKLGARKKQAAKRAMGGWGVGGV
jgi:hypothetical protein